MPEIKNLRSYKQNTEKFWVTCPKNLIASIKNSKAHVTF